MSIENVNAYTPKVNDQTDLASKWAYGDGRKLHIHIEVSVAVHSMSRRCVLTRSRNMKNALVPTASVIMRAKRCKQ